MSLCVNTSSKQFKETAKRLNISEGSLENIVHEYMNSEGSVGAFPSDSHILSKVEGQPFTEPLSEKQQKLIELKYSKPIVVDTYAEAKAVMNEMAQYFAPKHIGLKETLGGKFEVSLNTTVDESLAEEEKDIFRPAEERRIHSIMELESDVASLQKELESLDRKSYINNIIKTYNSRVEQAQKEARFAGRVTSDGLHSFIESFNSKYSDLIEKGIINKLDDSISSRIVKFDSDGRAYYELSKIAVKRNIQAIKADASSQLQSRIQSLNSQLIKAREDLSLIERAPIQDFFSEESLIFNNAQKNTKLREFVLSEQDSERFRKYLENSRGKSPNKFATNYQGRRVILRKSDSDASGRSYDIVEEDGTVIAKALPLYTAEEKEALSKRIKDSAKKFKPYNEGRSMAFKAFLQKPSKGLFKFAAKTWLSEAAETGALWIDYKDIDNFVDKFSESFWENVVTYVLEPQRGKNENTFGMMFSGRDVRSAGWVFNPTIPKQGLIEKLEAQYGIKIDGRKVFGEEINRALKYGDLEKALVNYLEPILNRQISDGKIKTFKPVKEAIRDIQHNYDTRFKEYLEKKGLSIPTSVANIIFNREIFSGEETKINRLATIFHEPFHALEILAGKTKEMNDIYSAFDSLVNTEYGKELLKSVEDFNTVYKEDDLKSEILANLFSMLMMSPEQREAFLSQDTDTIGILGAVVGKKINELLSAPLTERYLQTTTVTEERKILRTVTEEEREVLPILKRIWNGLIKALEQIFKFSAESIKFAEKINLIDKTISETIFEEKTYYKEEEKLNTNLMAFKHALDNLNSALLEITNVEITEATKLRQTSVAKNAVDENGLSKPKPQEVRPELAKFQESTSKVVTQLTNLMNSGIMSNTEIRHVAEQAVYFISDRITEFLENPSKVFEIFPERALVDGKPMTEEQKAAEIEKIRQMSRLEFAKYITPENLISLTKARLFTKNGNENINSRALDKKAQLITDNFDAVIRFANYAFATVEGFAITSLEDKVIIEENPTIFVDDFDGSNSTDTVLENEGSLQEHWQIESRTLDILSSMSALVRQALNKCFQIRINPETGAEEHVPSEFGIAERINAKDATSSILRWTKGAESLSHMVQLLDAKAAENPWIKQITERLKDTSGKEADFQSQFYGVFAKAFQPYSIVLKEYNEKTGQYEYKSIQVNQHPALTDAVKSVEVAYKTNNHPLFDNGKVRKDAAETLAAITNDLVEKAQHKLEENDRAEVIDLITKAVNALGYTVDETTVNLALDSTNTFVAMVNNLKKISDNLTNAVDKENYNPFKYSKVKEDYSIGGYLQSLLKPLTDRLEDTAVSSFYDSGKMYQSYVTPSYLTVMMNHFHADDASFKAFLDTEFGSYEWFKNADGSWRNVWLETLAEMPKEKREELFKHKVQLNFNKHNYMKNMSDVEYGLSILSEYFSESGETTGTTIPVWYRVPMMSNKPSSEFIRMYAYTGSMMKYMLTNGFSRIFQQELSRIQTVDIRGFDKNNPNFIKNFDKNGKKFMMLDFFNKYLEGGKEANSELGRLINKAIEEGTAYDPETKKGLTQEENARMADLVNKEIVTSMDAKADSIIAEWKANGVFEGAKQIANIGKDDAVVETKLREFVWNDTFAAMNILELTITDPAFYKDAEDLQKRLAQIHAPGIRANVEATDYKGKKVTDGKFRTILLKDFDDFVSNIKDNLRIVFDRKLKELEESGVPKEDNRYKAAAATYDNIIEQFNHINVADAQGYSSPTSYRKKAFIFGKWSERSEDIYKKLIAGNYNYSDLQTAFQPLKPFVYGQVTKPAMESGRRDIATPLTKFKVPVQFKNSEYLLIMADAILQGEDTGKPNLLRAIYEVMEESAENDNTRGIDTIQFESTCKSGLMAPIDIKQYYNMEGGEALAKHALEQAIYNKDGSYNTDTYVYEVPFENYAIQQEVPEHFKNHFQAHGSQIRYIIPTDLESVDSEGNAVTYNYFDRGEEKKLSAEEYKAEYERNISENIEASINELSEQLGIGNEFLNKKDRNVALSRVLLEEILSSPRYGAELAFACTVNSETGEFNIPLGDPIQSKRVEQLINSIVKNRINKQEIAGGPVVQVTNFGTSRELNIRFKDKNGGLLKTRAEWIKEGNTEDSYKQYIEENQAGIAYYEVFAPIFSNELFEKFADKNGNIDIETIEKINPELLEMIGYRIPTEDKYSMAPLKIVGFLPREAGDGIMLPNDITLLTGSDFDVDKFYLMRKEISITHRYLGDINSATLADDSYIKKNGTSLRKELLKRLEYTYDKVRLSDVTKGRIEERADILEKESLDKLRESKNKKHDIYLYRKEALERQKNDELNRAQKAYDRDVDALENELKSNKITEEEYNSKMDALDETHDKEFARIEEKYQTKLDKLTEPSTELTEEELKEARDERNANVYDLARAEQKRVLREAIDEFLEDPFKKPENYLQRQIKDIYVKYMFDYVKPTEGTTYRNNKIVDMSWAVLTNETTASKMLTPGGFEPEKRMGYLVSAFQNPAVNMTWEELNAIQDIDELKALCYTDKNLCYIDTHLQFYRQNAAAATALGMAAVQKVAHAVLESNGFSIDVSGALDFVEDEFFSIAGKEFSGMMEIDKKYNDVGELIGRTLGEFVAMFADAVKDPVANLMNINNTTMPIVTALIRLGMPFEKVALFISQPAIKRVLELYNSENVTNFVRLSDVIEREIKNIENTFNIEDDSTLKELNTVTEEELVAAMNPRARNNQENSNAATVTDYKVLKFFQYLDTIARQLKSPTYATRFNSISNAVGPLVVDNLIKEYKADAGQFDFFYDKYGERADFGTILSMHPILESFYKTLRISRELLDDMPANSLSFRGMLTSAEEDLQRILFGDKKTLTELSDFYQSYLLISSGAIPTEATAENPHQGLKYYLEQFPADFMRGKAKELFKGNALIDAIRLDIQKGRAVLKIDTTGMTTPDKEKLSDGWNDLYNSGERGRKLAEHLFYYNFWRTGIGFSPKSFMSLFPIALRSKIKGYNEAFNIHSDKFSENVVGKVVLDQFVRNNADNNKLAPRVKIGKEGVNPTKDGDIYTFSGDDYYSVADKPYIKIKSGNADILLKRVGNDSIGHIAKYEKLSLLGNNGEYFEASVNSEYTPLANTAQTKQQANEGQVQEVSNNEVQFDDTPSTPKPSKDVEVRRATKIRDMLLRMFMMSGRTEEQARAKMEEFKNKSPEEQAKFKAPMKKFIANKFDQINKELDAEHQIKYDEELLEEMYNELC